MRASVWEGIGKELKIKRKFYVSSRDVRIVCIRLKKVQCTLVQALRICTVPTAHRGSRGVALPFRDHDTGRG
jgi:hypothetical protein